MSEPAGGELLLVGAGGHAAVVADALAAQGLAVTGVVAAKPPARIRARSFARDEDVIGVLPPCRVVLGIGGVTPAELRRRMMLAERYRGAGFDVLAVVHPSAVVSPSARIEWGAFVGPGAVVNAGASVGRCAIINSAAVVEHDAGVGAGSHAAPRAVLLGGARVGECSMIGSAAVILPYASVPDDTLVPALSLVRASQDSSREQGKP